MVAVGDVNRAKLYYLRGKVGKKARVRELRQDGARGPRAVQPGAEVAESDIPAKVPEEPTG